MLLKVFETKNIDYCICSRAHVLSDDSLLAYLSAIDIVALEAEYYAQRLVCTVECVIMTS